MKGMIITNCINVGEFQGLSLFFFLLASCPRKFNVLNGHVEYEDHRNVSGGILIATLHCDRGYEIHGETKLYCHFDPFYNGIWSDHPPNCQCKSQ